MNRIPSFLALSLTTAAICVFAGVPHVALAQAPAEGTVDLLTTPPELTAVVAPNVVLTFDDSGSMGRNYMPDARPYTGVGWGGTDQQNTIGDAKYPGSDSTPFICAGVIDPRVTDPANPRSWAMNGVYYNPNATYAPPLKADGSPFPDASFINAWDNGILANRPVSPTSPTRRNLGDASSDRRFCGKAAGYYRLKTTAALTLNSDGKISNTGVLYTANNWEWVSVASGTEAQKKNFANWYSYYHTRYLASVTSVSRAYATFDRGIRVAYQNINNRQLATSTAIYPFENVASGTQARNDFYTWLFSTPVGGNTPNQTAANRVGQFFQRKTGNADTNPYWDRAIGKELSCRKNFHIQMTDGMWNNSVVKPTQTDTNAIAAMPDGRQPGGQGYSITAPESKIFWNEGSKDQNTMADIAFHYWATDLRPDFKESEQTKFKVRPYLVDRTNASGNEVTLQAGQSWLDNKDLYWNPANDPATWPHLVQFMIGFGVDGTIPKTDANYARLRKGEIAWPALQGNSPYSDTIEKIDDMWHAAINSRGEFFAASNPEELIHALQKIIASVVAQSSASTPQSVSLPILTGGNSGYQGGYDSSDWSGSFVRSELDEAGKPIRVAWDAGCLLTGGRCLNPPGDSTARDPGSRFIFTSDGAGNGIRFLWDSLTASQKIGLSRAPGASVVCSQSGGSGCDAYGAIRVDYLRGKRDAEATGSAPQFRSRTSVLGAVINSEPVYVSSPRSGYHDMFPSGSPEAEAAAADKANSYAAYQNQQRSRQPMAYVGSNDGLLHAFNAQSGKEEWAYIPDLLVRNGRLAQMTNRDAGLVSGVDSRPREADVYVRDQWRTILLGSLRLGGRGIYALDVTIPNLANEAAAAVQNGKAMWEFTSGDVASKDNDGECAAGARSCASLGYTYDSVNVARIRYQDKWVAVVSSGYFPSNADVAAAPGDRLEAAAKRTSLMIVDIETGTLIREIKTTSANQDVVSQSGFKSFGLSTPMVYDEGSDEVDDVVYAGDLAGNLWRFDLSDKDDPSNWSVDLMFTAYGDTVKVGDQPIVFNPTALRDPVTRRAMLVVGTGKYLGKDDRTSNIPEQAFYGVRDYGRNAPAYPIKVDQLVTQTMVQGSDATRTITGFVDRANVIDAPPMYLKTKDAAGKPVTKTINAHGWRMRLNVEDEKGERAQRRAVPLPSANVALLYGLIPKSDDPCDPGARYSVMAIDAGTGAAITDPSGSGLIGVVIKAPAPIGDPVENRGGAGGILPGLPEEIGTAITKALDEVLQAAIPPWHRGAWRELLGW